jgi:hypothetical protein
LVFGEKIVDGWRLAVGGLILKKLIKSIILIISLICQPPTANFQSKANGE